MSATTRWWLIRHAPVVNPGRLIYGRSEVEADTGDTAAFEALAAAMPADALWVATPLSRTRKTVAAIGVATAEPLIEPDLAEQHFGEWQGLTHDEVNARYPRTAHRFWLAPAAERPPGGESFVDLMARVSAAMLRLTAEHAGRDIVAVAHGGTIRAALALALDLDPEAALRFRIDTLSRTRLDHIALEDGAAAWRVEGVNLPPA